MAVNRNFPLQLALAFSRQDFLPEVSVPFTSGARRRLSSALYAALGFAHPFAGAILDFEERLHAGLEGEISDEDLARRRTRLAIEDATKRQALRMSKLRTEMAALKAELKR